MTVHDHHLMILAMSPIHLFEPATIEFSGEGLQTVKGKFPREAPETEQEPLKQDNSRSRLHMALEGVGAFKRELGGEKKRHAETTRWNKKRTGQSRKSSRGLLVEDFDFHLSLSTSSDDLTLWLFTTLRGRELAMQQRWSPRHQTYYQARKCCDSLNSSRSLRFQQSGRTFRRPFFSGD